MNHQNNEVPFTAVTWATFDDFKNEVDPITQNDAHEIEFPVAFLSEDGQSLRPPIYDIRNLSEWALERGNHTFPHSRAFSNFHELDAVRWSRGGPTTLQPNYFHTTQLLLDQARDEGPRVLTYDMVNSIRWLTPTPEYHAFRIFMAAETRKPLCDHVSWLYEYWKYHPINNDIDDVGRLESVLLHQYQTILPTGSTPLDRLKELANFRWEMSRRLHTSSGNELRIVNYYWRIYPMDQGSPDDHLLNEILAHNGM